MDSFFTQTTCDRCGGDLSEGRIMSMYNTDCICMRCKKGEKKRADYMKALNAETKAVLAGNRNYPGIGW